MDNFPLYVQTPSDLSSQAVFGWAAHDFFLLQFRALHHASVFAAQPAASVVASVPLPSLTCLLCLC